jgi:hypothetical protein
VGYLCYPYRMSILESGKLLTEKQLADQLGISVSGLRKLRTARKIPFIPISYRTVRFDLVSVRRALKKLEKEENLK